MSNQEMKEKILERFSEQQLARKLATYRGWTEDEAVECIYYSIFDPEKAKQMVGERRRKEMEADMRKMAEAITRMTVDVELAKMEKQWRQTITVADEDEAK